MSLRQALKNVFEATIGDGSIIGRRQGQVALAASESQFFMNGVRDSLRNAKLECYELSAGDKDLEVLVWSQFRVSFNGRDYKQKLCLMRDGRWTLEAPARNTIDIAKDKEVEAFCVRIAEEAEAIAEAPRAVYDKNGERIEPFKMVLAQVKDILKADITAANIRLNTEISQTMLDGDFQGEARREYEDVIRDRVHAAIQQYEQVGPEAMHRFVDELYCKKIHDS